MVDIINNQGKRQKIVKLVWIPLLMVPTLIGKHFAENYAYNAASKLDNDSRELVYESVLASNLLHLKNEIGLVQNKIRGVIITGEQTFLYGLDSILTRIPQTLEALEDATQTKTNLNEKINQLDHDVHMMLAYNEEVMASFRKEGASAAQARIESQEGIKRRQSIFNIIDEITSDHLTELEGIAVVTRTDTDQALVIQRVTSISSSIVIALISIIIYIYVLRQDRLHNLLRSSAEREKQAYRARDQFITNMNHELRTPLHAVIGYSSQLKRTSLDEIQQKFVAAINAAGESLLSSINYFLDYKKLDSEAQIVKKGSFSLPELINDLKLIFDQKCESKHLKFNVSISLETPEYIISDYTRIREILTNLIGNAIKFTDSGKVSLSVYPSDDVKSTYSLVFKISDTGIGIPQKHQQNIFNQFYQVDSGLTRKHEGTGLGLAITKRHVGAMKGSIQLKSKSGVGTEISVELPIEKDRTVHTQKRQQAFDMSWVKGQRILVVDDNQVNLDLVDHILTEWNFKTCTAKSGFLALDLLSKKKFDLIFLDIQMPKVDGYTVAHEIRNSLQLNIPVIGLSAHSSSNEKTKARKSGMDDYLTKPFKEKELANMLQLYLYRSHDILEVDLTNLKSLSKGKTEFENRMISTLLSQFSEQAILMDQANQANDTDTIKKIMHDLKPNIELIGVSLQFEPIITKIAESISEGNSGPFRSVDELKRKIHQVIQSLRGHIIEGGGKD